MHLSVHLNFQGNCAEAFAFYQSVFGDKGAFLMKYSDAPAGAPVEPDWADKVMHTSLPLGDGMLMGCDAPAGRSKPMGGFQVSVSMKDAAEVKRIYEALAAGGSVEMPLAADILVAGLWDVHGQVWRGVDGECAGLDACLGEDYDDVVWPGPRKGNGARGEIPALIFLGGGEVLGRARRARRESGLL